MAQVSGYVEFDQLSIGRPQTNWDALFDRNCRSLSLLTAQNLKQAEDGTCSLNEPSPLSEVSLVGPPVPPFSCWPLPVCELPI